MIEQIEWSDVKFTLGGVEFPVDHVAYSRRPDAIDPEPVDVLRLGRETSGTYEIELVMTTENPFFCRNLFVPAPSSNASNMTLAKRISYGGRKGRSAWRRLRAQGFVGILRINDEAPVPCPPVRIVR